MAYPYQDGFFHALNRYGRDAYLTREVRHTWVLDLIAMGPYGEVIEPDVMNAFRGEGDPVEVIRPMLENLPYWVKPDSDPELRPLYAIHSILRPTPQPIDALRAGAILLGDEFRFGTDEGMRRAIGILFAYGRAAPILTERLRTTHPAFEDAGAVMLNYDPAAFLRMLDMYTDRDWEYEIPNGRRMLSTLRFGISIAEDAYDFMVGLREYLRENGEPAGVMNQVDQHIARMIRDALKMQLKRAV